MKAKQSIKELLSREFLHDKEHSALHALAEGEQAAVDTYNLAIAKVRDKELIPILENCRDSHAISMGILRRQIEQAGDKAPATAGWWGTVAGLVEGGATMLSDRIAMSVLAAGEEFGTEQCEEHMKDLDSKSYQLAEEDLLPAQKKTLETMTILCAWLKSDDIDHKHERHRHAPTASNYNIKVTANNDVSAHLATKVADGRPQLRTELYNPFWFG